MSEQALTAIGFTIIFLATAAGSALVFAFRGLSEKLNTLFHGAAYSRHRGRFFRLGRAFVGARRGRVYRGWGVPRRNR